MGGAHPTRAGGNHAHLFVPIPRRGTRTFSHRRPHLHQHKQRLSLRRSLSRAQRLYRRGSSRRPRNPKNYFYGWMVLPAFRGGELKMSDAPDRKTDRRPSPAQPWLPSPAERVRQIRLGLHWRRGGGAGCAGGIRSGMARPPLRPQNGQQIRWVFHHLSVSMEVAVVCD